MLVSVVWRVLATPSQMGMALENTKALAKAQDAANRHQQKDPGRNAEPTQNLYACDGPQKADQVKFVLAAWDSEMGWR